MSRTLTYRKCSGCKHLARMVIILCTVPALLVSHVAAQKAQRVIILGRANVRDPVKIVAVLVHGKRIENGGPFQADGGWIESSVVVVENLSSKTLTCIQLGIEFPEMRDASNPASPLTMTIATAGAIPDHQLYARSGQKIEIVQQPPISIGPGQTIEIPISAWLARVKSDIEKNRPFNTLTQAHIWIQMAFFDDGTKWNLSGVFSRPDPGIPGKYDPISKEEFDGSNPPTAK